MTNGTLIISLRGCEKNRMHPACLRSNMFQEMAEQTDVKIKKNEGQSRRISEHFSCLKQWGTPDEAVFVESSVS